MKNIINKTVAKIKRQGIVPESRWKFLFKKYALWAAFFAMLLFGALSFSVTFDSLRQLDWDLYRFVGQNFFSYSLPLIPYFWVVLIGLFLVLSFIDLRKTETGYRYSWLKIFFGSAVGVLLIGFVFSWFSFGARLNSTVSMQVPFYRQHMMMTKEVQWMQPSRGFLSGSLVFVSDSQLEIKDLNGEKWIVLLDEKTLIRPSANIANGEMIKIIGAQESVNKFRAIEIRPWAGRGMMNGGGFVRGGSMMNGGGGMMRRN